MADASIFTLAPGAEVGDWRILCHLGAGGFGDVWLADHRDGRRAALKVPRDPSAAPRLAAQAALQSALDAPEIVPVLAADLDAVPPHVAYEYVEAGTLAERLPLPLADALPALAAVARALAHAHARGVLHLDLKPSNILVHLDGRVRVTDFGARAPAPAPGVDVSTGLDSAAPAAAAATLAYTAPEQRRPGLPVDARADVYAFGLVLFETLTGRLPTGHERPREASPGLPAAVDALHARCCAPLARRPRDASALLPALRALRLGWRDRSRVRRWRDRPGS